MYNTDTANGQCGKTRRAQAERHSSLRTGGCSSGWPSRPPGGTGDRRWVSRLWEQSDAIPSTHREVPGKALQPHAWAPDIKRPVPAALLMGDASLLPSPLFLISAPQQAWSQGRHGLGHSPASLHYHTHSLFPPLAARGDVNWFLFPSAALQKAALSPWVPRPGSRPRPGSWVWLSSPNAITHCLLLTASEFWECFQKSSSVARMTIDSWQPGPLRCWKTPVWGRAIREGHFHAREEEWQRRGRHAAEAALRRGGRQSHF